MTLTLAGIFLYSCSPSNRIVLDSLSIDIPYEIKDKTDKGNQIVISTENPDIVINIEENKNQKLANATVQTIEEYSTLIDTSKTEFPKIDNVELVTKWPIELESGFKGYQVLFEYNNNSYIIMLLLWWKQQRLLIYK